MPDEPLASRTAPPQTNGEIEAAVAAVEARLIAKPDDGKGWAVIAPVYMRLERYADAAHAYAEALRLVGEDPLRRAAYGEALVAAAGGVVTDEARQAFDRALAEQPGQPQARFYLALGAEQDGKKAEAIRAFEQILADSPPEAPWRGVVSARLAAHRSRRDHAAAFVAHQVVAGITGSPVNDSGRGIERSEQQCSAWKVEIGHENSSGLEGAGLMSGSRRPYNVL